MNTTVTLLMSQFVTHDVKHFIVSKPPGFSVAPGQGVELAINRPGLSEQGRPFTPTGLAADGVLEFTIKGYADHADGVTRLLHQLEPGAELLMSEPFGTISYQGPGVFIAGGAGITPFLAILRDLARRGSRVCAPARRPRLSGRARCGLRSTLLCLWPAALHGSGQRGLDRSGRTGGKPGVRTVSAVSMGSGLALCGKT